MISYDINPFQVLYVTDNPDPFTFVRLFSDYPVRFSLPVFEQGNVVLKGSQGAGKSMLLNLLRPEIRIAYATAGQDFPVPPKLRRFLAAGINLTLSGALDLGQRPISGSRDLDEESFPLYFADFLNYFIVRDLLRSIQLVGEKENVFEGIVAKNCIERFSSELAQHQCWFGYLKGVFTFSDLCAAIDRRLAAYRSFHQFNAELPDDISQTKTRIGAPIASAHDALKETGVLQNDVPLFIRIDQLERLYRSDVIRPELGLAYRRVVNKAIGQRDSRVSYRIGTRPYAWDDDLRIYGTDDRLEHLRDFRVVDLEMRRKEDRKTWLFPLFAADAFRRRLENAGYHLSENDDLLSRVFGTGKPPEESAREYAKTANAETLLRLDDSWPVAWRQLLDEVVRRDPFTAVLAAAWARQRGGGAKTADRRGSNPPANRPWNKQTWRKERVRQGLMQIAARNRQRLKWVGKESILGISTPNISVFLSVCHEIWDALIRSEQRKSQAERTDPLSDGIHPDIQAVGIQTASQEWHEKIVEQPFGHDRQRFVDVLGRLFRKWLIDDVAMVYPGHNGFSLEVDELRQYPNLQRFLQDAADYGDLQDADHTTRSQNRKKRKKWYLSPILSPFFQIPEAHPKEPRYTSVKELASWLEQAQVDIEGLPKAAGPDDRERSARRKRRGLDAGGQRALFDSNGSGGE